MTTLFGRSGGEFLVNSQTANDQYGPTMTGLSNGGFVVSWQTDDDTQDGSGSAIKAQIFDAGGVKTGGEFLVNSQTMNHQSEPTVTALNNGGFVVSWRTNDAAQDGSASAIKAQIFSGSGVKVGDEFRINSQTSGGQFEPAISGLNNGGFVVSWASGDEAQDGHFSAVKAQIFAAGGARIGNEFLVNSEHGGAQHAPTIGKLNGGGFVISWHTSYMQPDGGGGEVNAQIFNASGAKVGGEILLSSDSTEIQQPTITGLSNGGFVVSWGIGVDAQDSNNNAIKAQIFDAGGARVGTEFLVNSQTVGDQFRPKISALSDGGFVASWVTDDERQDGSGAAIKAQVFDAGGAKVGKEFLVNSQATNDQHLPTITGLSNGGFAVGWYSNDATQDGSGSAIKAQVFKPQAASAPSDIGIADIGAGIVEAVATDRQFTISVADLNVNDVHSLTIVSDSSGGAFSISNGALVVSDARKLDFETQPIVNLTIRATDLDGLSTEKSFAITVKDAVENVRFIPLGTELTVNGPTGLHHSEPTITGLSNGGFVVSWTVAGFLTEFDVYAQIFDAAGVKVGGEFLVHSPAANQQYSPTITALSNGGFVVSWENVDGSAIKAQVFDAGGAKVGGEFLVNSQTANSQDEPTIAGLSNGGFVVSWRTWDEAQDGSDSAIKAQLFSAGGAKLGGEFLVNSQTAGSQSEPAVTGLSNGGFVVSWQTSDGAQDGSETAVKAQLFDAGGVKVGGEFLVNTHTAGEQSEVTIAGLSNGGFVISWFTESSFQDGSGSAVKAQIFNASGAKVGEELLVNSQTGRDQLSPTVSGLSDGGFVVSWYTTELEDNYFLYRSDPGGSIQAQAFDASGRKVGGEFRVSQSDNIQYTPVVAGLNDGDFVVSWRDGVNHGIRAQIFSREGISDTPPALPRAIADSATIMEDQAITISVLGNDYDPNGDGISLTGAADAPHGATKVNGDGTITYTPDANFEGTDSFSYTISDGKGGTATGTVTLTVTAVNDAPVAVDDGVFFTPSHTALVTKAAALLANDSDLEGTALSVIRVGVATNGTVSLFNGQITFKPNAGYAGAASYEYIIADAGGNIDSATVSLTVGPAVFNNGLSGDFNGDGRDDLIWRHDWGLVTEWLGQANGGFVGNEAKVFSLVPTYWQVVGTGDFNGDGRSDLIWRDDSGLVTEWLGQADGSLVDKNAVFSLVPTNWNVVGTGDFNGDGRSDVIWRNDAGVLTEWLGQANGGLVGNNAVLVAVPTSLHVAGTGDFNGDGRDDILWRNDSGLVTQSLGQANGTFVGNANVSVQVATSVRVVGIGDFNGDGRDDVLWRNDAGLVTEWLGQANGGFIGNDAIVSVAVPTSLHVAGIGDYNGDGRSDILWRNDAGLVTEWLGQANGGFVANDANVSVQIPTNWQVPVYDSFAI